MATSKTQFGRHTSCRPVRLGATPAVTLLSVATAWLIASVPLVDAQLPATRLFATFPTGGQQGTKLDLEITSGADLEGVAALRFSHPGITAVQKTQQVEGTEEPQPVVNQFTVEIAGDVPCGLYEVRALGTYGLSNPRFFSVGTLPETVEAEANNTAGQATEIPLGTVINARAGAAGDIDYYRFEASAGQRIVVDCFGERIDSRIDAVLELYDANGRRLAESNDFNRHDPLLDFAAPHDGEYLIRVFDFLYNGSNEYFYRLRIDVAPYLHSIFPPSALPGEQQIFTILGRNLPNGTESDFTGADGQPLEQMTVEIEMPDDPSAAHSFAWQNLIAARDSLQDGLTYRLETPDGASNPLHVAFATAPVVIEQEPNDLPTESQPLSPPCEWVGRFQSIGDRDMSTFDATKGQVYWIEVFSQRLGLPTDPYLLIQRVTTNQEGQEQTSDIQELHEFGNSVGGVAFNSATDDPVFRFAAPEDGTYRLLLHDLYNEIRGDARYVYRVSIRPETPDFRLVALSEFPRAAGAAPQDTDPWTIVLRKGGTAKLMVMCFRRDSFAGPIDLAVEGLPEGVECSGATIGPGQTSTRLVFTAGKETPVWSGTFRVTGKGRIGESEEIREVRAATTIWPERGVAAPSRLSRDIALSVIEEAAPYGAELAISEVELPQSHRLHLPLTLTRRGDFKAKVDLTAAFLPEKVQNAAISLAPEQSEGVVHLFVPPDAPPGKYTFYVQAASQVPYKKPAEEKVANRAVADASTPVTVTITPGPAVLAAKVPGKGALKKESQIEISVQVNRRNEFAGAVTLDLLLPPGIAGVSAEPVEVAADANQATIILKAAGDATEGNHAHVALRGKMEFGGETVEVHQPIPLNIQK